jgi:hypothetical protein
VTERASRGSLISALFESFSGDNARCFNAIVPGDKS